MILVRKLNLSTVASFFMTSALYDWCAAWDCGSRPAWWL